MVVVVVPARVVAVVVVVIAVGVVVAAVAVVAGGVIAMVMIGTRARVVRMPVLALVASRHSASLDRLTRRRKFDPFIRSRPTARLPAWSERTPTI